MHNLYPGDRVEMTDLMDDPDPIPVGTQGTVVYVDTAVGQIDVEWDNGRTLFLLTQDPYRKI